MNTDDFHYISEALIASKHLIELTAPNSLHTKSVLSRIEDATVLVREIHDARIIEKHEAALASVPENDVDRYFREDREIEREVEAKLNGRAYEEGKDIWPEEGKTYHTILIGEKHVVNGIVGPQPVTCRDAPFHVNGVQYGPGETATCHAGDVVGLGVLKEGPKVEPRFSGDTCVSQPQRDYGDESAAIDAAQQGGLQHGVREAEAPIPTDPKGAVLNALKSAGISHAKIAEIMDGVFPQEPDLPQSVKDEIAPLFAALGIDVNKVKFRRIV